MTPDLITEFQTAVSFTLINVWAGLMVGLDKVNNFLPKSLINTASNVGNSVKTLLIERNEARVAAILLALPILGLLGFMSLVGVALLWPLSFVLSLVGSIAAIPWYLFHPDHSSIQTIIFSAIFAIGTQFIFVLPLYFLTPFIFTAGMAALSVYWAFIQRRLFLVPVTAWWVLTSPYWMAFHFIGFPVFFVGSIVSQLFAVSLTCGVVYMYPDFPSKVQSHYARYQHYAKNRSLKQHQHSSTSATTTATASHTTIGTTEGKPLSNSAQNSTQDQWSKITEKHSIYRDHHPMKEEHKEAVM